MSRIRAWIRGHMSSYGGVSPPEYDEECVPGEGQPEGEGWLPLTLAKPSSEPKAWLIWYHDVDRPPEFFSHAGAEEAARKRFEQVSASWNCLLFVSPPNAATPQASPSDARDAARLDREGA